MTLDDALARDCLALGMEALNTVQVACTVISVSSLE